MAKIRTVTTLRAKRAEILSSISQYEKRIAQARADLSHVNACIALFEVTSEPGAFTPYVDTHRLFARGELMALCKDTLASGPKTTKDLALCVMRAKGSRYWRQGSRARSAFTPLRSFTPLRLYGDAHLFSLFT